MKQFLKFTLASMLGIFLSFILFFIAFLIFMTIVIAALQTKKIEEIPSDSVLEIQLNYLVPDRSYQSFSPTMSFPFVSAKKQIGFGDVYAGMEHANENANQSVIKNRAGVSSTEAYDSKKTMANFDAAKQLSNYIRKVEPTLASKLDNIENWLFQRQSIFFLLS